MTLPASGTITLGQINTELGRSSSATISLKDASTGVYGAINTNSTYRPNASAPYSVSEWYCYNHNAFAPQLITTTGSGTWVCPTGCTSILVECWGSGGAGGNASTTSGARGGGGAGGQYVNKTIAVTPGTSYSYNVAPTRAAGAAVTDTWFLNTSTVIAKGGANGSNATTNTQAASASGSLTGAIGDVTYAGGSGNTGAGGGGAGSTGTGNNATASNSPGAARTEFGGAGGARGALGAAGVAGSVYGGGGGGGQANSSTLRSGGNGAQGLIRITNVTVCVPVTTTTTTTTAAGKTVSYFGDTAGCTGASMQFIVNGVTVCSGTSCSGTVTAPIGALIQVNYTTGPKPSLGCDTAFACIGSTDGGCEFGSDTQIGASVTATVSYTVTAGSPSTIYMNAGVVI